MKPTVLLLLLGVCACAGTDAVADAGADTDAGADAGTDAGVDAGMDASVDAGTDAGVVERRVFVTGTTQNAGFGGFDGAGSGRYARNHGPGLRPPV